MAWLNEAVFRLINNLGFTLSFLNPIMVFIAKYMVLALAIGMIVFWFKGKGQKRTRKVLVISMVSFVIAELIGKVLGKIIEHPQPFATLENVSQLVEHKIDNSFPSDHTILFFSICIVFFLAIQSRKKYWFLVLPTVVGISRIWVGVHYPVDVLVGAVLGIGSAWISYRLLMNSAILERLIVGIHQMENKLKQLVKK